MCLDIPGSPYQMSLGEEGSLLVQRMFQDLSQRVEVLRAEGKLSESTLRDYYGETRFEQIAQSNALEGSTLSVGETDLAVLKGITITGHDPGFSKDAQSLARALDELTEMAKFKVATNLEEVRRLHEIILSGRNSAGVFRNDEVRIRGSGHVPPRTWKEVMTQMEHWESWSENNVNAPPLLRASILHAWLEHIHPFADGNGRTGRAITNLEMVRAGYPPIIIRRKDRDQYLEALQKDDEGEIGAFLEFIGGRLEDALRDLERAAQRKQGYDAARQKTRLAQANRLDLWNAGVHLLFASIKSNLEDRFSESNVSLDLKEYDHLKVDDFIELCEGHSNSLSWAFLLRIRVPGMPAVERLAWASNPGPVLGARLAQEPGRPVLKWSVPNPDGYPRWMSAETASPGGEEMTIVKDRWLILRNKSFIERSPSELASEIAEDIVSSTIPDVTL